MEVQKRTARQGRDLQRYDGIIRLTAGCVCLRADGKVLIVSSLKSPNQWTLPKGGWDSNETVEECAVREAEEEGGVLGTIDRPLGTWIATSKKSGKASRLHVFLLHVTEELSDSEWAESDVRQRRWVDLEYALEVVHREEQHNALLTFKQSLV